MNSKLLFPGILFFLVFFTILILGALPNGPNNTRLTGYFSKPSDDKHYSEVPWGTNLTAHIVIDSTSINAIDIINCTFGIYVKLNVKHHADEILETKVWNNNFTLYRNQIRTFDIINVSANRNASEDIGIFIDIQWIIGGNPGSLRMDQVVIGPTFNEQPFFSLPIILCLTGAIGMGFILFLILLGIRHDIVVYRRRKQLQRPPTSAPAPLPPSDLTEEASIEPAPAIPPATPLTPSLTPTEPLPIESIILIPCPQCSSKIDKHQVVCPNCGHEFQKCVVCNLIIEEDEETEACPECGALGHRDHFREWIHINGKCPICKATLSS